MIIEGSRNRKTNPIYNKVYQTWYNMKQRCCNPNHKQYKNYGAKGVNVCDRWMELNNFIEDIDKIEGFNFNSFLSGELALDKDKLGNSKLYSLENCCFITLEENNKYKPNQQKSIIGISPNGEIVKFLNQSEFARQNNLKQTGIKDCLKGKSKTHRGWKFNYEQ